MYREEIILPLVVGKRVLDCGGVDHWATDKKIAEGTWLHAQIAACASSCIGVDILEEPVKRINQQGKYNFIVANVEQLPFYEEFDVVVAGEIVEHLYNMGSFLDSVWRSLCADGYLIITTPNFHRLSSIVYSLLLNKEVCHPEHTCYYSKQTLSYIVEKHGFVVENHYLLSRKAKSVIIEKLRNAIIRLRPTVAETILLVARKVPMQHKYADKW